MPFGEIAWKLPTGLGRQGTFKVTTFNSSGTWYKNRMSSYIMVLIWSSGQGGASGRQGATTAAGGGGGGAAGASIAVYGPASWFANSETITIGAVSNGGNAQSSATTNGNPGNVCNNSSFGSIFSTVVSATAPTGGTTTTAAGGGASSNQIALTIAGNFASSAGSTGGQGSNTTGTTGTVVNYSTVTQYTPSAGGGGSGGDSTTARQAGTGGSISIGSSNPLTLITSAAGGIETGTVAGSQGTAGLVDIIYTGGGGGGGGGGMKSIGPGIGGAGGFPGGGGGGGGGSINGTNSGAGGQGAAGQVIVFEFFV